MQNIDASNEERVSTVPTFFLSSLCGVIGAIGFIFGSGLSFTLVDTTAVLIFFSWMASTQVAHTLLQKKQSIFFVLAASVFCLATGIIYGLTVDLIEVAVAATPNLATSAAKFYPYHWYYFHILYLDSTQLKALYQSRRISLVATFLCENA